ncbi:hypothetical protein NIES593_21610 [Hydrococcus rivularis NIES-593]|uniref:Recombinase family protein n=1 Tax=Hydrococcus rivularis NIES-593 TaxID=1921803 RepID=A0A1U7H827_9CYAN|nr:hypothetical protein [Hydrococcus rivularis]OKH18839.1 hypothetical protein NIES593_21610 [Hydrococcus rivularis NIES-593]
MLPSSIWIIGLTRTGKTTRLIDEFRQWVWEKRRASKQVARNSDSAQPLTSAILVFAANNDNRRNLADRLSISVRGSYPVLCKTPLGFICDEVTLFWPLLFERLHLKAQFPLRLRPETEQELATRLWRPKLDQESLTRLGIGEYQLVRRTLDLLQLAGASGIPVEDIPAILAAGFPSLNESVSGNVSHCLGELLMEWRQWCLERGLLSYGIIYELYWRYLLPDPVYQEHLSRRYQAVFADDTDDYPAIIRDLCELLLDRGAFGVFTYNRDGRVRMGLNADPDYLAGLASRCRIEELSNASGLGTDLGNAIAQFLDDPTFIPSLPPSVLSIQTISRAQLLRKTAETIIEAVEAGEVRPEEIAIIAPGLDEIARYTLIEILSSAGIPIEPLNEQRPLISSPLIRALLTLLALVYPGLGRLVGRDLVAEMLVALSQKPTDKAGEIENGEDGEIRTNKRRHRLVPAIDPVRAGLIADYCYQIDPEQPRLLPVETFSRWDRLGYRATKAYQEIAAWIEETKSLLQQQHLTYPVMVLDRALKHFVGNGAHLPYDCLSALRELMETAQHFWEVDRRLRLNEPISSSVATTVAQFIQLLRRGTISANPRPVSSFGKKKGTVTLATIFQYRSLRSFHRWQFWLDASSHLWDKGGAATLYGAPLFLREWSGRAWMPENELESDRERLGRILRDLLGRVGERVYLCHSDLGVNGTEQMGPLSVWVRASREYVAESKAIKDDRLRREVYRNLSQ